MMEEDLYHSLLRQVGQVEQGHSLKEFNPFGAGGVADYFIIAKNSVELASAVKAAIDHDVPYTVVGSASSILFSDGGFPGLVIRNQTENCSLAADHSQLVADSGVSLSRLVTFATGYNLGGLTNFYGFPGTAGGALYGNALSKGQSFISTVRYFTMIVPPARLDKAATIVRYRADWLAREDGSTRLYHLKNSQLDYTIPQPVILSVVIQLTSVRADELQQRLVETQDEELAMVQRLDLMGPLFFPVPGIDNLNELLRQAKVPKLRIANLSPDRHLPNFLTSRGKTTRSTDIRQLISLIQDTVREKYAVELIPQYEYLGVW